MLDHLELEGNMKKILVIIFLLFSVASYASDEYDVVEIYKKIDLEYGTLAINSYGSVEEVKTILVPTTLKTGNYEVEVTRIDYNIYKIYGTDIYIKTRNCYVYAYNDDAILIINSQYGYTKGEIIFLE